MMALTELIAAHMLRDEAERAARLDLPQCRQLAPVDNGYEYQCTRPYEHDGPHAGCTWVTPIESFEQYGRPLTVFIIAAVWPR